MAQNDSQNATRGYRRQVLIINRKVQMQLIAYAASFSIVSSCYSAVSISLFKRVSENGEHLPFSYYALLAAAGFIIFAAMAIFGFILTNRICGPVYRVHKQVREMLEGKNPEFIRLRTGDEFVDLISDVNELQKRFHSNSRQG